MQKKLRILTAACVIVAASSQCLAADFVGEDSMAITADDILSAYNEVPAAIKYTLTGQWDMWDEDGDGVSERISFGNLQVTGDVMLLKKKSREYMASPLASQQYRWVRVTEDGWLKPSGHMLDDIVLTEGNARECFDCYSEGEGMWYGPGKALAIAPRYKGPRGVAYGIHYRVGDPNDDSNAVMNGYAAPRGAGGTQHLGVAYIPGPNEASYGADLIITPDSDSSYFVFDNTNLWDTDAGMQEGLYNVPAGSLERFLNEGAGTRFGIRLELETNDDACTVGQYAVGECMPDIQSPLEMTAVITIPLDREQKKSRALYCDADDNGEIVWDDILLFYYTCITKQYDDTKSMCDVDMDGTVSWTDLMIFYHECNRVMDEPMAR